MRAYSFASFPNVEGRLWTFRRLTFFVVLLWSLDSKAGDVVTWPVVAIPLHATNVVAVAAGRYWDEFHDLALRADGTVIGWGCNGRH
jgi:hypothetical protein